MAEASASVDELLALDLLTLREHTERAGAMLDPRRHADLLRQSLRDAQLCTVRRHGALLAYAMFTPEAGGSGFVQAFCVHPGHRTPAVFRELMGALLGRAHALHLTSLRSHVYRTNTLSLAFHQALGFRISREGAQAVELTATLAALQSHPRLQRLLGLA